VNAAAARDLTAALEAGWPGFEAIRTFLLAAVAGAHEYLEERRGPGRVVLVVDGTEPRPTPRTKPG
jgi:hypothetical protein